MKTKVWYFIRSITGAPIENARINVYIYPKLGGDPIYCYVFPTIDGQETTTEVYSILTDYTGYFEFYVADEEESINGYEFDREFKITWSKPGLTTHLVDKIQLFDVANRPLNITQVTTVKNKMISNLQGKTWEEHITLSRDDHLQYLRTDGTRALSGDWDIGSSRKILAENIWGRATYLTLSNNSGTSFVSITNGSILISVPGSGSPPSGAQKALEVLGAARFKSGLTIDGSETSSTIGTVAGDVYIQATTTTKNIYLRPDGPASDVGRLTISTTGITSSGTGTSTFNGHVKTKNIGFLDTTPNANYGLYADKSYTDPTSTAGVLIWLKPLFTVSAPVEFSGIRLTTHPRVSSGISNTGIVYGVRSTNLRNMTTTGDSGTLTGLTAWEISYGHSNAFVVTPTTTNVYGLYMYPYRKSGTITNMYDIYLAGDSTGGAVTNRYGIYQANAGKNYFAGNVGIGESPYCALTVTTSSELVAGFSRLGMSSTQKVYMYIGSNYTANLGFTFGYTHNTTASSRRLFIGTNEGWIAGGDLEGIIITGAGNVGINGVPTSSLTVRQAVNTYAYGLSVTNLAGTGQSIIWNDVSNISRFDSKTDASGHISLNGAGTGFVGIGTVAPAAKLEVKDGNIHLSNSNVAHGMTGIAPTNTFLKIQPGVVNGGVSISALTNGDTYPLYISAISGEASPTKAMITLTGGKKNTGVWKALAAAELVLQVLNYTTPSITVLGSGNVGIGTVVPDAKLAVWANIADDAIVFQVGNYSTDSITVLGNGNMGIGKTTPGSKLSISDLPSYFDNEAAINGGLTAGDIFMTNCLSSFNATTDWTLNGAVYYTTITHPTVYNSLPELWDINHNRVFADIIHTGVNNTKISVTSTPDARFAGRVTTVVGQYSTTFNGTSDWTIDGNVYYTTLTHPLSASDIIVELLDSSYNQIFADVINVDDSNIKISVTSSPDARFAGSIVVAAAQYTIPFNATTDWTLNGDVYYATFTHGLASHDIVVELWDGSYNQIFTDIINIDSNNTKISVTSSPDARFAGSIAVVASDSSRDTGILRVVYVL